MDEIYIESNEEALIDFQTIVKENEEASFVEETKSMDGEVLIKLIIENLPMIISSVAKLVAILKSKKISFKIVKNGQEIESLEEA